MFDIGFLELLIIAVIALVVLGPERLPIAIKTTAIWVGRIKRSFQGIKSEIERELKVDEIRQEVHNASIMDDLKKTREELDQGVSSMKSTLNTPLNTPLNTQLNSPENDASSMDDKSVEAKSAVKGEAQQKTDAPKAPETTPDSGS